MKMKTLNRGLVGVFTAVTWLFASVVACRAQTTLTIDSCMDETNNFSPQMGAVVIGSPGDLWNGTFNTEGIGAGCLFDTFGNILPGASIGLVNANYYESTGGGNPIGVPGYRTLGLMAPYANNQNKVMTMSINGLGAYAGCPFTLVLYGAGNGTGQGDIINITGGATSTGPLVGATTGTSRYVSLGIGICYTNFTGTINGSTLSLSVNNNGSSGGGGYCAINGFQLQISGAPSAAPIVSTQPQSITVLTNNTAIFTVPTVSSTAVTYQWAAAATGSGGPYVNLNNGGQFSGVNSPTLTITNVSPANAMDYVVTVQNANGSVQSSPATLTVPAAQGSGYDPYQLMDVQFGAGISSGNIQSGAAVLGQGGDTWNPMQYFAGPLLISANQGNSFNFAPTNLVDSWGVVLTNVGVSSYNWSGKSSNAQGTPSDASYNSPVATTNLMGNYFYTTGNAAPSNAIVEIIYGLAPYVGENLNLVIYAAGNAAGQGSALNILSGASGGNTASTLTTTAASRKVSAGIGVAYNTFSGTLTNGTLMFSVTNNGSTQYGPINGFQLQLSPVNNEPPVIALNPASATVVVGNAWTFTVGADGGPGNTLSYQWYTNGVAVSGATSNSFTINPVLPVNSGSYYVVVSDNNGSATSAVANLSEITSPIVLNQFPVTYNTVQTTNYLSLYAGANPTFSVSDTGGLPIAYQWFTNGVAVGNATNAGMTLTGASVVSPGTNIIYCILTNLWGSATTAVWSASVVTDPANSAGGPASYPQGVLALNPIAYWRLNDYQVEGDNGNGDDGYIAYDYVGGNNAIYTNAYLQNTGYNPAGDPSDTSVEFGYGYANNSDAGLVGTNIDFSVPAGQNAEFSLSCWANWNVTNVCSLIAKGYGNGGEELVLCCDDKGYVRFGMRTANGTYYSAEAPISEGNWIHVVGVCDEANTNLTVFVNGVLGKSTWIPRTNGILADVGRNLIIGARSSSLANDEAGIYNNQFEGYLNDVAIFNYALNSNEVQQLFVEGGLGPVISAEPVNTEADFGGGTATFSVVASGATSYQWYSVLNGVTNLLTGQTGSTLVLSNLTSSATNYVVEAINQYGVSYSGPASVNVVSGAPQIMAGPNNPFYAVGGEIGTNYVTAYGTWPLAYQWQYSNSLSWVNVSFPGIFGTQTNVLTLADPYPDDAGSYQVVVTNIDGVSTSSPAQLVVMVPLTFNTNGANGSGLFWTANPQNPPPVYSNDLLTITYTNNPSEGTGVYFYQIPQYVGAFEASFTYEALYAGTQPMADGATFCIQNDSRGAGAFGTGGGNLAYNGNAPGASGAVITPSVALELNIFPGNGVGGMGYSVNTNGGIGPTKPPGSVVLTNVPVDVTIYYANGLMALTFSNEVLGYTFSTNVNVNIPETLGANMGYVGFTGAFGGDYATQTITNFTFVSLPSQAIALNKSNAVVSWPAYIPGYVLQQNSSVNSGNWVNVTNPLNYVNGTNLVIMPATGTNEMFYRLMFVP